jgi:phosphoglycerate kinase
MLDRVDEMIIAGGMAFTFKKELQGMQIGKSIYDAEVPKLLFDRFCDMFRRHLVLSFSR